MERSALRLDCFTLGGQKPWYPSGIRLGGAPEPAKKTYARTTNTELNEQQQNQACAMYKTHSARCAETGSSSTYNRQTRLSYTVTLDMYDVEIFNHFIKADLSV